MWLNKIIEEKIKCIGAGEDKTTGPENDHADKSQNVEKEEDLKWIYLTHCLRMLGSLKEMLIYAGVPIINSGKIFVKSNF